MIQLTLEEQRVQLRELRSATIAQYRPHIKEGPGPIRVMARIVNELQQAAHKHDIAQEIIDEELVNRTIGDIDVRGIVECTGEPGGPEDYRTLADDLGIALPGEELHGYTASGENYLWLRERMQMNERMLLTEGIDLRMYDIFGTGNIILRGWLAEDMQRWGIPVTAANVHLSIGAMDGIDKTLRGLAHIARVLHTGTPGILFPEPGFNVPEWQALSYGYTIHRFSTQPEHHFKLSAEQLDQILAKTPDITVIYLTVTNNPTAFAYSAAELEALHEVLRRYRIEQGRHIYIIADLAYIGTGKPAEDKARMETFAAPDILQHTIFVSSFSKTYTLTGDRFGYVTCGDPDIAARIAVSWSNGTAAMPGEWQLRYMACYQLLQERPWLGQKLRQFYHLRRGRLIAQLQRINEQQQVFAEIYPDDDATVYNWSRLCPGEDAFTIFEKTGIAGVPGSGFGYSDEFIRFSIGVIPVETSA
ncbi:pyridoxal phosphate-dependent aminotransferase [Ktedonobacteria bacterium brp13]|nr:pyridoxal phosphate-dependent aminotransferase [Ktedonobacteria bacterium brp13]